MVPTAGVRKPRLRGCNAPKEAAFSSRAPEVSQRRKRSPAPQENRHLKEASPLWTEDGEGGLGEAPTWGPGGPGEPSDPCAHGDGVVSSSRMRFSMSGERSFNASNTGVQVRLGGRERGQHPKHRPGLRHSPVPRTGASLTPPWVSQEDGLPDYHLFSHPFLRQTQLEWITELL